MNNLIPHITPQLNDILQSIRYFVPEVILSGLFILVFVTDLISGKRSLAPTRFIAILGIIIVLFTTLQQLQLVTEWHTLFNNMLLLQRTVVCFKIVLDVLCLMILIYIPWDKALRAHYKGLGDLYAIIIASVLGLHLMVMAVNLLSIYLAVEMVSVASYLMVAYRSDTGITSEAGLKYVLFGAVASAVMLYGISLIYGFSGTLGMFDDGFIAHLAQVNKLSVSLAIVLIMVGLGFKLSFVPMHFWVPDVYQGAATPITAYLSTLPKIAGFGLLVNFLTPFVFNPAWQAFDFRLFLSATGIITLIAGNVAAIWQTNIKRLLAYSSIGHTGFALMAIVTFSGQGISALLFYLAVYAIANIGALMLCSYYVNKIGAHDLDSYKGVGLRYPLPSVCFVVLLISLAGLPVSAGFNGKVLVFSAVYELYKQTHDVWLLGLMLTGAVTTVIALFYYIKIPLHLFLKKNDHHAEDLIVNHRYLLIFICIISFCVLALGVFPQLIDFL